ncbi:phage tail assembly chaperone [Pseudomonas extremaustralis]|uniref:phage tail assembly chaperone n=1 Tax=Pseudomonas extremaustralis TaxID=359110 RepID=UPI002AA6403C|nr:phage tail assembly chaperone [Pseudomonas extremaustralis]
MSIFYCAETGGFYLRGMQPSDKDCQEITKARHAELRAENSAGKIIAADDQGFPIAIDPPGPSTEEVVIKERAWRDRQLATATGIRDRHRDQLELGIAPTLAPEQFSMLLSYIQMLRDWPQSPDFPDLEKRPELPVWLAEQTE